MYLVVHVLIGIFLAIILKNPLLVLLFALVSHFIIDMVPHWQLVKAGEKFSKKSVISSFF